MRKKAGVSTLEMLMAMAFIAIAFLAVLQLLSGALISSGELQGSVIAQNLANQKMEDLMDQNFASLSSEARVAFSAFPDFDYTVEIASVETHLKSITVAVYWEVAGAELSYTVDTMLTDW